LSALNILNTRPVNRKSSWIFLSYCLKPDLTGYGNRDKINIVKIRSQLKGDSSNESMLTTPAHFGTHIDYPFHFDLEGKTGDRYTAEDLFFNQVTVIDISNLRVRNFIVTKEQLFNKIKENGKININSDLLLLKTGFSKKRNKKEYWEKNWGIGLGVADILKITFPKLKALGMDLISISSFQNREIGRKAHQEFLVQNNMLLIEDMDLSKLNSNVKIKKIIVAPLRFIESDASPATILAEVQ